MRSEDTQQFEVHRTRELPRVAAVKQTRRAGVLVVGGSLVVAGLILIPLPGPGILIVIAGLTVLSWEFPVAKRALFNVRSKFKQARAKAQRRR